VFNAGRGTWDAFSQGAYKALKENGRTEIKLYSIDISNQDLQLMRESGSPWKVSVAVDPKLIGATNVRLIANKIAGETTPATYDFKAAAIPQALLTAQPGAVNVATLGKTLATASGEAEKRYFFGICRKGLCSVTEDCTAAVPVMRSYGAAPILTGM
jgi:ABC-type sugar transport system substrate-binding protein